MAMIGENYLFHQDDTLGEMMYEINKDSITAVPVRLGENLTRLSAMLNVNGYYLKKINAHLKNGQVPNVQGYRINIPTSKVRMFYKRYSRINQPNPYLYAQR